MTPQPHFTERLRTRVRMLGRSRWSKPAAATLAVLALSGATGWGVASFAQGTSAATTEAVKQALKLRLPKTAIDAIVCKGLGGLCEVASKQTLFYVDRSARYLVIGRVYDMETRQDLTAARLLELNPDLLAAGAARRSEAPLSTCRNCPTRARSTGVPRTGRASRSFPISTAATARSSKPN